MSVRISINPMRVLFMLFAVLLVLFIFHALALTIPPDLPLTSLQNRNLVNFHLLFNFNLEANIPSFFSTMLFLTVALLCGIITLSNYQDSGALNKRMTLVTALFAFLALDDSAQLHEKVGYFARYILSAFGNFSPRPIYAIVGFVIIGVVVYYFWEAFWKLPTWMRTILFFAVFILASSQAVDVFDGWVILPRYGREHVFYLIGLTLEETMEFVGLIILVYTSLRYIAKGAFITEQLSQSVTSVVDMEFATNTSTAQT